MKHVNVTRKVELSPKEVTCTLEGHCAGAKRTCTTTDGKTLKETILLIGDVNRIFKYRIDEQDMMPLQNYVGTVTVLERNGQTDVSWSTEFDLTAEEAWPEVEKGLKDLFSAAITSLESVAKLN
jgi:hypothetical protein